jgi:hypothetical protein
MESEKELRSQRAGGGIAAALSWLLVPIIDLLLTKSGQPPAALATHTDIVALTVKRIESRSLRGSRLPYLQH